jgi:uncharacterized protein (AIM24 family)
MAHSATQVKTEFRVHRKTCLNEVSGETMKHNPKNARSFFMDSGRRKFGERNELAPRHRAPERMTGVPDISQQAPLPMMSGPSTVRMVENDSPPPLGEIMGRVIPILVLEVGENLDVSFDPKLVIWKEPGVNISFKTEGGVVGTLGSMFKRTVAGSSSMLARASGKGKFCLGRGEPGAIMALEMSRGERVQVREGAFLAATDGISCDFERNSGIGNVLFGGSGMFLGVFEATRSGILYVHGLGDIEIIELLRTESVDVVTHAWLWKDSSVDMTLVGAGLANAVMGVGSLVMHRFTGPGRVAIQTGRAASQPTKE